MRTTISIPLPVLLVLAGCNQTIAEPVRLDSIGPASSDSNAAIRDRISASYYRTLVHSSDGHRYTRGYGWLKVIDRPNGPAIELTIGAVRDGEEAWTVRMALPETALLEDGGEIALGEGASDIQTERFSGRRQLESTRVAQVRLKRVSQPGKRSSLQGQVQTSSAALSVDFRTEYEVECLVAPEKLGQQPNGRAESAFGPVAVYVPDVDFETPFCRKFATIR